MFSISHKTKKTQKTQEAFQKEFYQNMLFFYSTLTQIFKFKQKKQQQQLNKINHLLLIYQ